MIQFETLPVKTPRKIKKQLKADSCKNFTNNKTNKTLKNTKKIIVTTSEFVDKSDGISYMHEIKLK